MTKLISTFILVMIAQTAIGNECVDACKEAFNVIGYSLEYPHLCNCSFPRESVDSEEDCLENCIMYHMNGGCYFNKSSLMCKASRIIELKDNEVLDPSADVLKIVTKK
jgi:hypothetical protein